MKDKVLIKLSHNSYSSLIDFLEGVFYRDKNLAKVALKFLEKIYRTEYGISSKQWRSHISELFNCYPIDEEDEAMLNKIYEKYKNFVEKERGKKPYYLLLKKDKNGEIELLEDEKIILEKAAKWNASISSYYSILRKLKCIGLIEKKKGYLIKSKKIFEILKGIKECINSLNSKEKQDYVYAPK